MFPLILTSQYLPDLLTMSDFIAGLRFISKKIDEGRVVDVAHMDFSKAFDKVLHDSLIQRLMHKRIQCY